MGLLDPPLERHGLGFGPVEGPAGKSSQRVCPILAGFWVVGLIPWGGGGFENKLGGWVWAQGKVPHGGGGH